MLMKVLLFSLTILLLPVRSLSPEDLRRMASVLRPTSIDNVSSRRCVAMAYLYHRCLSTVTGYTHPVASSRNVVQEDSLASMSVIGPRLFVTATDISRRRYLGRQHEPNS